MPKTNPKTEQAYSESRKANEWPTTSTPINKWTQEKDNKDQDRTVTKRENTREMLESYLNRTDEFPSYSFPSPL